MVDKIIAKNLYTDKTKQLFNKRILQQLEHFVRKNNLVTQAQAMYQIHTAFQNRPEILLSKAMDMVTSNQLRKITNAQFEKLQIQITQNIINGSSFEHQVMSLLFNSTAEIIICNNNKDWSDKIVEKVKHTFEKTPLMGPTEQLTKENWKQ
ncbi:hypothetical protein G9A89_003394 [Geosiphon pyriformis]|nr:hypothetical protein G9A89_003394 [Geosiphon pyriformis]